MISKRQPIYLIVIMSLIFALCGTSLAVEKFKITPRIAASWQVDDNFFEAEINEREVYTYLIQPGFDLGFETAKSLISLSYTMNLYNYDDQDTVPQGQPAADEEDYTGHNLRFRGNYKPSDRLLLGLEDFYHRTRDQAESDRFSNSISREKYSFNEISPKIIYEIGPKLSSSLKYKYKEKDYDNSTEEDSAENRGIVDLVYKVKPKTLLGIEYQQWKMNYDLTTSDYSSDQIKLIFRKQFKNFSFEAGAGYHNRSFDDNSIEDIDIFVYRVAFIGQNPPAPEAHPRSSITLAAEQNFNDLGEGQQYFKAQKLSLNASHIFMGKIAATIDGFYQESDYETTTGPTPAGNTALRNDKTVNISASLGYIFTNWLTFSLTGGHEDRNSNLAGFDYDNRYYMAKVEFSHSLGSK